MKLTTTKLDRLEESLCVYLTPEQRLIMLHWYGHEPRHGWDEDDFAIGIQDVMRFYPDHRPKKGIEIELTPRQMKDRTAFVKREAAEYLAKNTGMTPSERKELLDWLAEGESVYENPWYLTDEDGHPLDFLEAARTWEDMKEPSQELPGVCGRGDEPF